MTPAKQRIIDYIEQNASVFTSVSDQIWELAELSLKEFASAQLYLDVLKQGGFQVEENICGIQTAFSGSFGHGKPVIGILAEFDALSGLSQKAGQTQREELVKGGSGHGCGHNMLGAGSLAAAFAIKDYLSSTGREGTVIFYGCPGEEGGAGKAFMGRARLWEKLDCALTWHPSDANEVSTGTCNSCIQALYQFKGVAAHAAGNPEAGRSALDGVELMNIGVQYLREHMSSGARIHYAMVDGGGFSPNVVQPHASVLYMVRSTKVKEAVELTHRVDDIAKGAALMTGTSFEKVFIDGTANTVPNSVLEKQLYANFLEAPLPEYTPEEIAFAEKLHATYGPETELPGLGAHYDPKIAAEVKALREKAPTKALNGFVMPLYTGDAFSPGSTDVGDVSWLTPTAQIHTACFPSGAPGHSWQNVSIGKTSVGHKGLLLAGKVLAMTAADLFEHPEIIDQAKKEFAQRAAEGYTCPIPDDAVPIAIEL